jgi:hypothetical protein
LPGSGDTPFSVSAVPGTRQAWAIAGYFTSQDYLLASYRRHSVGYLLHFGGLHWSVAATFVPQIMLQGVSAVSAEAAWVWGMTEQKDFYYAPRKVRPFLALVSGGVVHPMRPPSRWWHVFTVALTSRGGADTWLAGGGRDRQLRWQGPVLERWDGASWHTVPDPVAAGPALLSTSGPAATWALNGRQVMRWTGASWSQSYTLPISPAAGPPRILSGPAAVASAAGRAWVVYNDWRDAGHDNYVDPRPYSAYFNGQTWQPVPAPKAFAPLAEVTMSATDAWALTGPSGPFGITRILHHQGSWCPQPLLPWRALRACHRSVASATAISEASPSYVIAIGGSWQPGCAFAYVYDGRAWRPVNARPDNQRPPPVWSPGFP